jgi:hypothetical protein
MPRKRKQDIRINDNSSLEGLCQETYNDALEKGISEETGLREKFLFPFLLPFQLLIHWIHLLIQCIFL